MKKNWRVSEIDRQAAEETSRVLNIDIRLARFLAGRGFVKPADAKIFLQPGVWGIHNPFLMSGLNEAVRAIRTALEENIKIGIFSDSDLDGLTSLALMMNVFSKQTSNLLYRFPKDTETYGLSKAIIDEFNAAGVKLIITVDSGIRDIEEIEYAKKLGINVIVTDHHEPADILPQTIIVNPLVKGCPYPYKLLAGVGVAFKVCLGLLLSYLQDVIFLSADKTGRICISCMQDVLNIDDAYFVDVSSAAKFLRKQKNIFDEKTVLLCDSKYLADVIKKEIPSARIWSLDDYFNGQSDNFNAADISSGEKDLQCRFFELLFARSPKFSSFINETLPFVAIGSIADIVPLTGENRTLTALGIAALKNTSHLGLAKILGDQTVTSKKIAWSLSPLLNSPGRFGLAELTAKFLLQNKDPDEETLGRIVELNEERKRIVETALNSEDENVGCCKIEDMGLYATATCRDIPSGFAGLIANRLTDRFGKPAIVLMHPKQGGLLKGSGRAPYGVNFFSAIEQLTDLFDKLGGHAQAFGFSVSLENVPLMHKRLPAAMENNMSSLPVLNIGMEIAPDEINEELVDLLSAGEPFGKDNEEPLLLLRNIRPDSFLRIGKMKNHGKFIMDGGRFEAIGWGMADTMDALHKSGSLLDIVFTIEKNDYKGGSSVSLFIKDIDEAV